MLSAASARTIKGRFRFRGAIRLASTTLGHVDYDSDTHVFRSNLTVEVPELTVSEFVWRNINKWEHLPALTCAVRGKSYTYGQAKGASTSFGINLTNDLNLQTGDAIAIVLPNMPEFAITFLGAASAGLAASTANPIYTSAELSHQFSDAKVRAVVTAPDLVDRVRSALKMTPSGGGQVIVIGEEPVPEGCLSLEQLTKKSTKGAKVPQRPDLDSIIALPYSSGTTGKPKGVILTHRNMVANLCQLDHPEVFVDVSKPGGPQAKDLAILPMFHIYGLNGIMNLALSRGHHLISLPRFEAQSFTQTMKKYKPNALCMAPPLVSFLCKSTEITSEDLNELQFAMNGAAPAATSIVRELVEKVNNPTGFIFKDGFGMTEVSCAAAVTPTTLRTTKYGSCGSNLPLSEIKIVDVDNGNALPLGQIGELQFRGPNVMKGYLNNEQATKDTLVEGGWLRTGDIAYVDPDGCIFIVDRLKELIKVKGFQVSPTELEEVLRKLPQVADVAVIGIPDGKSGELPKAFVVRKDQSLTEDQVSDFMKDKVAPYKQLKGGVQFIDTIPRSTAGKILRKELKSL